MSRLIILILLYIPVIAFSQEQWRTRPIKKDNLIIIVGDSSESINYSSFGKFLVQEGFSFKSSNEEFKSITTNEKTSQGGYQYTMNVSFKDSLILIRVRCNYVTLGSSITSGINTEWTDWLYYTRTPFGLTYEAFYPLLRKYSKLIYFDNKK